MKTLQRIEAFFQNHGFAVQSLGDLHSEPVFDLHLDSRGVNAGDAFIAIQGGQKHGLAFLSQVLDKKPGLVLSDRPLNEEERSIWEQSGCESVFFWSSDLKAILPLLADWFYDAPSRHLKVVGITGTNGKTSTAFYTAQLLEHLGNRVALIGTLGNGYWKNLSPTLNTTPDVISVQRLLADFLRQGYEWVVMEVSSHALSLGRVDGVHFQTVALTQITRDHLDFHGSVEAYRNAKKSLFTEFASNVQIVNLQDETGRELCDSMALSDLYSYRLEEGGHSGSSKELLCNHLRLHPEGLQLSLSFSEKHADLSVSLLGRFNAENLLCALSILLANGFSWHELLNGAHKLKAVDGRMQTLCRQPIVVLDFAHTADALRSVLQAIRDHLSASESQLWVLFGCGGNRDRGKRPLMAQIAEQLANKVVVTSDNPRDEDPEAIIGEICQGFSQSEMVTVIQDRRQAIEWTLQQAADHDLVLLAGKGHETYQEIAGIKYPFSDAQIAGEFCRVGLTENRQSAEDTIELVLKG